MKNEVTRATKVAKEERAAIGVRKVAPKEPDLMLALEEPDLILAPKEPDLILAPKEPDLMEALVEPCIKLDLEAIKMDMKVDIK